MVRSPGHDFDLQPPCLVESFEPEEILRVLLRLLHRAAALLLQGPPPPATARPLQTLRLHRPTRLRLPPETISRMA